MTFSKPDTDHKSAPERSTRMGMTLDARTLFAQSNVVLIKFKDECYQLRQTRNGKLILTK